MRPSNPHEASPKIGVLPIGGRKSLGGRGLSDAPVTLESLLARTSLKAIGLSLGLDVRMVDGHLLVRALLPRPMWSWRLSASSSFCRAVVQSGLLTHRQMVHAAWRYRLGRSKDDAVIYWQMDQLGQVYDGKLMWYGPDCHRLKHRHASWVMYLVKQHFGIPQDAFQPTHVFFGTHLLVHGERFMVHGERLKVHGSRLMVNDERLNNNHEPLTMNHKPIIAVVEAEKSAVILSELYPQYIWLAAGGMNEVQVSKFLPLRHYRVILFPDTDPEGRAFRIWYDAAQQVMRSFFWPPHNPIRVSPFLELHASSEQKQRKIDLVDYIFESKIPMNDEQ